MDALQDVSFEVLPGEVQCIAGENGTGKSTLIKVITGVYQPAPEAAFWSPASKFRRCRPRRRARPGFEVIWQDLALFPEMSVAENIGIEAVLGTMPRPVNHRAMRRTAKIALAKLGARFDLDAPLGTFAIAQRQIVAIARALVGEARVIFMDEPTSSLTRHETTSAARDRPHAFGYRHLGRLCQPSPGRGARHFHPRHGTARWQAGWRLSHRRHDPVASHRTDDRQDLRTGDPHAGPPGRPCRAGSSASDPRGDYSRISLSPSAAAKRSG